MNWYLRFEVLDGGQKWIYCSVAQLNCLIIVLTLKRRDRQPKYLTTMIYVSVDSAVHRAVR
jgi:hypothetical protein